MQKPDLAPTDPRLASIRDALQPLELELSPSSEDLCPGPMTTRDPGARESEIPSGGPGRSQAAVSLILRAGEEVEILLIRRAEADGDPWSGHIALPGGRRDPSDPDLLHTAIREAEEETALHLGKQGVPLGCLEPLQTTNPFLPPLFISPFVFGVNGRSEAEVASAEVEEVFWIPLASLFDSATAGTVVVDIRGEDRTFPCFRIDGRVVWGLTYRILSGFINRLGSPPTRR